MPLTRHLYPATARLRIIGLSSVTLRRSGVGTRPNVEYLGRVSETPLVNEYQEATAFVLPSLYEGFGLSAIEAQCGYPVIASDAAAIPETLRESAWKDSAQRVDLHITELQRH